ncbi:NCS1 nucleoside transporter [Plectosphaerella cucumerina]|uniref:NCS1 nucleoside transporter n=1 Tax=Plectosphaerella cucumerina TaxID=40658 RepID=A0A8K0X3H2_9PEZI|nr:NCS1 nucleoside transporter [Plectosphaerella cucumerina]
MALWREALSRLEIPQEKDVATTAYMNRDTRPLPPSRRTYGPWQFVGLWVVTGSFNIGGWTTGSAIIALGLNVWQAMLTVIIGHCLVGVICVLAGGPGAKWHVGFSIIQKASWGMWGSLIPLVQRIMLSFIWYSTQVYWGGQCVRTFIAAIWPSFNDLRRPLANGTMTVADFTGFVIFSMLCLPLIWIRPERYHVPFAVAAVTVIPTMLALFVWCVATVDGLGPLVDDIEGMTGIEQAKGARLGWMLVLGVCTNISGIATHLFSQSDYTRFARRPRDQLAAQLVFVPTNTILVAFIGIVCTSCAAHMFPHTRGTLVWEPFRFLDALQYHNNNSSLSRVAVAFASLAFIFAQFGIAVAQNALSNGIDLSALAPRVFNLRRGAYLTAAFAFIMQPWQLLNGANKFLTVMGGYGVFLGSMTGIMFADYYIVRRRTLKLTHLYELSDRSVYWYWRGINPRAVVAWVAGTWPLMPGFVRQVQEPGAEWKGWSQLYYLAWPLGCLIAGGVYCLLHFAVAPMRGTKEVDDADYFGTFGEEAAIGAIDAPLMAARSQDSRCESAPADSKSDDRVGGVTGG